MKTKDDPMMLKVGELAKRAGLTVRTLHHYDSIGLLSPSARSDPGYRLYNRADIARLHQIQALRRFGMALADIGAFLANPDADLAQVVEQQMAALQRQIAQATTLHGQLQQLHHQLQSGTEPELADWLTTLELMTMYDKYFSKEELAQLPLFSNLERRDQEWPALVAQVQALLDAGVPPDDPRAQQLAREWMIKIVRDTDANPAWFARLNAMHQREDALRERSGISMELMEYVLAAKASRTLAIYAQYLDSEELAFTRAHYGKHRMQWPALIAEVAKAMREGVAPTEPAARRLAMRWFALFRSYAGENPATHLKLREAHAREPELAEGSFITPAMLVFVREASQP